MKIPEKKKDVLYSRFNSRRARDGGGLGKTRGARSALYLSWRASMTQRGAYAYGQTDDNTELWLSISLEATAKPLWVVSSDPDINTPSHLSSCD